MLPIVRNGLVLELHFNELEGSTVYDLSGNNNNGTIFGATRVQEGFNRALSFDGVDDYVEIPHSSLFNGPDITASFWLFQRAYGSPVSYITKRTTVYDGLMFFMFTGYHLFFYWGDGANSHRWDTGYIPPLNTWVHLTITRDNSERKLFVNGKLFSSTSDAGGPIPATNTAPLRIMADTLSLRYFVNGIIDEVFIWNRALSESEIKAIYNYYMKKRTIER